uniref:Uncharacterized protein n=2 Tax=Davidia involucrata TaxID=16924 RepID=A0A5B6YUI3_DAVIN
MGGSGSSSKRKYSKRKSSKISSEARRRKKSRRTKSKKLHRRDDSISSYSDDDSRSLASVSSSSSEDDYRRARSRRRSDVKGSRKRAQRRSIGSESSKDLCRVKKRKGSKRNGDSEVRKKSKKKKPKIDASISSISSDSRSCSTCRGGSSSSGESEFGRPRGRSRENNRDTRDLTKGRSGTKNNKIRSRSSCSRCSDSSDYNKKQKLAGENSSRRLRSVVTVPKPPQEEEREWDKDGHKEEIVYDHDDYPSCRSNDSNDWGSKRDLAHVASEKRKVENVKGEESLVSNIRTTKFTESCKISGGKDDQSNPCSDAVGVNNPCKESKSEVSATIASSNGDDLESILRQKALENLSKFRGGLQTNAKTPADQKNMSGSDVKQSSTAKAEFVQNKLPKEGGSRVLGATQVIDQNARLIMKRDSSRAARIDQKIQERKYSGTESEIARRNVVCPPDQVALSGNPQEKDISPVSAVTNKSESGRSALRQESLGTCSILKQSPMSQASPKSKLLVTDSGVNNSAAETSQTVDVTSNKHGIEVNNACESAAPEHSSCLKPTMSVMRGGEMVQVNYKVYIPKKPSALARRQLRR